MPIQYVKNIYTVLLCQSHGCRCPESDPQPYIDGLVQEKVTPLLAHWSYVFFALTHWYCLCKIRWSLCSTRKGIVEPFALNYLHLSMIMPYQWSGPCLREGRKLLTLLHWLISIYLQWCHGYVHVFTNCLHKQDRKYHTLHSELLFSGTNQVSILLTHWPLGDLKENLRQSFSK